jgi:ElaB/YqjD/DUF883 family membrane-anchored ribosome-binding protein
MKNQIIASILVAFMCLCVGPSVFSQKIGEGIFQKQGKFKISNDSTATFEYLEIQDTGAFRRLTSRMRPENFPISVVKKPVFDPFVDLIQQYESQLDEYIQLEKYYITLDSINGRKMEELNQLNNLQSKRVDNYKLMADDLRASQKEMSDQLTQSLKIAKDCNSAKVRKQVWTAVLGGAVGFTVGALITFIAK